MIEVNEYLKESIDKIKNPTSIKHSKKNSLNHPPPLKIKLILISKV